MVGEKAKKKVGPVLNNVLGATAGKNEEFEKKYSKAMKASGIVWDEKALDEFLAKPKAMVKKTKMGFAGLKKASQRADVIAYIVANTK